METLSRNAFQWFIFSRFGVFKLENYLQFNQVQHFMIILSLVNSFHFFHFIKWKEDCNSLDTLEKLLNKRCSLGKRKSQLVLFNFGGNSGWEAQLETLNWESLPEKLCKRRFLSLRFCSHILLSHFALLSDLIGCRLSDALRTLHRGWWAECLTADSEV